MMCCVIKTLLDTKDMSPSRSFNVVSRLILEMGSSSMVYRFPMQAICSPADPG
jgi:hypothetical protein